MAAHLEDFLDLMCLDVQTVELHQLEIHPRSAGVDGINGKTASTHTPPSLARRPGGSLSLLLAGCFCFSCF